MIDEEIKEAVDLVHEYGCIKAIGMEEEDTELINAFQTLIDLGKLYLTIAGMGGMPKERKGYFVVGAQDSGHWVMTDKAEAHNLARQECILAQMKREQELKDQVIYLTKAEIQSGLNRVRWAELLIKQLPENHEGRNSWLLNYGSKNGD